MSVFWEAVATLVFIIVGMMVVYYLSKKELL